MARPRRRAPEGRQNAGERPEKGRCAFDKVVHNGSGRRRSGVRRAACVPCTMGGSAAPVSVRTHLKRRHGRRDVLAWAALASRHARSKVQRRTAVARDAWRGTANGLFPSSVGWILPHPQAPPGVARLSRSSRGAGLGEVGRPTAPLPAGPAGGPAFPPLRDAAAQERATANGRGARCVARNGQRPLPVVGWVDSPSPASAPRGRQTLPVVPQGGTGRGRTANGQRPTANGQRPTANGQRPTANGQRPTARSARHIRSRSEQLEESLGIEH